MTRGVIVPAASVVPVASVLAGVRIVVQRIVRTGEGERRVHVGELHLVEHVVDLVAQRTPLFFRPIRLIGKRRDSVRSHSCHVGCRRIPTGVLPKLPMLPFGCGMRNAARLKCGRSANGRCSDRPCSRLNNGSPVSSQRAPLVPSVNVGLRVVDARRCSSSSVGVIGLAAQQPEDARDLPVADQLLDDRHLA